MPKPLIEESRCKGCGLCIAACPRQLLNAAGHFNSKGYHPVACSDDTKCVGCGLCATMCPDMVIAIQK